LSILKNPKVWQRFEQLVLVHAVRHTADLSYGDEIQNLVESSNGRLRFVPFVSRESYLDALSGRIPTALESGILQSRTGLDISPTDTQFMICGNPQMVKDTSTTLQQMGFERNRRRNPGHITVENYW
jgi:ferredoxin--NADP+ reductase